MRNDDIVIRPFQPASDTQTLSRIWLDASLVAHAFISERRLLEQRALIESQYLPKAETWVACLGVQSVGFISLLNTFVGGIFVSPTQQGLGIGRLLIAHALSLKNELSLEVYVQNQSAVRFYKALGFKELSRRATDDEGYPFENAHMQLIG